MALRSSLAVLLSCLLSCVLSGCGGAGMPRSEMPEPKSGAMPSADTLGNDVYLISIPSDDDTLIGKVQIPHYREKRPEALFQANTCRKHLEVRSFAAKRKVRDIRKFTADINSSAVVEVLQVGASASKATDYQYEFEVSRKLVADDTVEYAECCSRVRGGCGNQFVSELYYGEGSYRLLEKSAGSVEAGVPLVFDAAVSASYAVLAEQSFRGFFAYKVRQTPAPPPPESESRVVAVPTDSGPDFSLPETLQGAALLEQQGALVLITTQSDERFRGNQLKGLGNARQKQRRALRNLLAGPPYNTPPSLLNSRVEEVYRNGEETDAYQDENGDWFLKMGFRIE